MKTITIVLFILILGCQQEQEMSIYRGGVVMERNFCGDAMIMRYTVKYNSKIYHVYPYEIDYGYNAGDTIK